VIEEQKGHTEVGNSRKALPPLAEAAPKLEREGCTSQLVGVLLPYLDKNHSRQGATFPVILGSCQVM
jgi:hypothetical protein